MVPLSHYSVQLPRCTELSSTEWLLGATVFSKYPHCFYFEILGYTGTYSFRGLHVINYHLIEPHCSTEAIYSFACIYIGLRRPLIKSKCTGNSSKMQKSRPRSKIKLMFLFSIRTEVLTSFQRFRGFFVKIRPDFQII